MRHPTLGRASSPRGSGYPRPNALLSGVNLSMVNLETQSWTAARTCTDLTASPGASLAHHLDRDLARAPRSGAAALGGYVVQ